MSDSIEHMSPSQIATGKAHYSKNWDQQKQNDYNRWYYQQNKDKWANSEEVQKIQSTKADLNKATNDAKLAQIEEDRATAASESVRKQAISNPSSTAFKKVVSATARQFISGLRSNNADAKQTLAKSANERAKRSANKAIQKDMAKEENKEAFEYDEVQKHKKNQKISRDNIKRREDAERLKQRSQDTLKTAREFSKKMDSANDKFNSFVKKFTSGEDLAPSKPKKSTSEKVRHERKSWLDRTFGTDYTTTNDKARKELSNKKYKKKSL